MEPDVPTTESENVHEVDPITGEILPSLPEAINADNLADIGRWVTNLQRSLQHLGMPVNGCLCDCCNLTREIRKLIAIREEKKQKIGERLAHHLAMTEQFVASTGREVIATPGVGRFRFRALPASLDSTKYDALSEEEQRHLRAQRGGCFNVREIVSLDRKRTLAGLQEGDEMLAQFFAVKTGQKFEFKPD